MGVLLAVSGTRTRLRRERAAESAMVRMLVPLGGLMIN
jgi:hypothetical protein